MIRDDTESVESGIPWCLVVLGQYGAVLVGTWGYSVLIGRYWLVPSNTGGTWSAEGSAVWYFVVLCQYGAALLGTWWYWVSIIWYCLTLSVTWLVKGFHAYIY